jgi:6-phosphogluconolactonase
VPNDTLLSLAVGSYSEPVPHAPSAHGKGVQVIGLDLAGGTATTLLEYGALPNPAFVQPHPTLPVLYVISEVWTGAPGTVSAMRFSDDWAELVSRTELPTGGFVPSYVSVAGDFLLLCNYGDGTLTSVRLGPAGELVEQTSLVPLSGTGPVLDRQEGPHAHCLLSHPYNGFLYAADLGADLLLRLTMDLGTGVLEVVDTTTLPAGAGPRHLVFTPSGEQALLVEELSSTLAVFDVQGDGDLALAQRISLLPEGFDGFSTGADIVLAPSGDTVFASNRGHDSVVRLDLGAEGWQTTSWTPTGMVPRGLALSPDGATLVVANQDSNSLQVFAVTGSGLVEQMTLPSATPTVVRFLTG